MSLRRLQVTDFRCLQSAAFDLDPRFTLISGPNASGKTSVLEAIHVLGRGRSFRTRHLEHLIRPGNRALCGVRRSGCLRAPVALGVEGSKAGMRAKVAGDRVSSLAELAALLPVQIIDPEIHRLIEEGPSRRRRFLDWGVFHVETTVRGGLAEVSKGTQAKECRVEGQAASWGGGCLGDGPGAPWGGAVGRAVSLCGLADGRGRGYHPPIAGSGTGA